MHNKVSERGDSMTDYQRTFLRQYGKYMPCMSLSQKSSVAANEIINGLRKSDDEMFAYIENNCRMDTEEQRFVNTAARLQIAEAAFMR